MPISRSSAFRDVADLYGPGTPASNGYGKSVLGPGTDVLIKANMKIGLFSKSLSHDWIKEIGGGPENLLDWSIAVPSTQVILDGDAFHVAAGDNPGIYRVKQRVKVPARALTFCLCNKE